MTTDQRTEAAQARFIADFARHPLAKRTGTKFEVLKWAHDIFSELAAKYLGEQIPLREKIEELQKALDTQEALAKANTDYVSLKIESAQLKADIHAIMSKLLRLQPAGSPPPTGDPVVNAYWIVDHIINSGYFPKV